VTTQNIKFFLIALLGVLGMMLYNTWQEDYPAKTKSIAYKTESKTKNKDNPIASVPDDKEIPMPTVAIKESKQITEINTAHPENIIQIKTDLFKIKIDKKGGDIIQLILTDYAKDQKTYGEGYVLFDDSSDRYYIAQSGLASELGPDSRELGRTVYHTNQKEYEMGVANQLIVNFTTHLSHSVSVIKQFVFERGSYVIGVGYIVQNKGTEPYTGNFYARLKRRADLESGGGFLGIQTFTGAALNTPSTPYKKISFKDIAEKPLEESIQGGWAAMIEHYFVSAWIPENSLKNTYQTQNVNQDVYMIGLVEPSITVLPGEEKHIKAKLYAGPEITEDLEGLAPGLELAVDYGVLWPICQPIFWLLKKMFQLTHNWGIAIILVTVIIKLLFYRLSASSYRSMGNMRKLQPRLEALKERYADDKQKFSQAMMELYKKEKINPLGGCLPVVIQIPVFIALYYVLLGSVELREAPFIFWITDLSAKDPYYVLPILMGASMLFQQRLNPTSPDPVQAKVMMFMPIVFTGLFLSFPSGLVLYWLVNNILSIAQQWVISKRIDSAAHHHGAK